MEATEPETLSGAYDDLLADLGEALSWVKGDKPLKTTTLSRNEEQKAIMPSAPLPATTPAIPDAKS